MLSDQFPVVSLGSGWVSAVSDHYMVLQYQKYTTITVFVENIQRFTCGMTGNKIFGQRF